MREDQLVKGFFGTMIGFNLMCFGWLMAGAMAGFPQVPSIVGMVIFASVPIGALVFGAMFAFDE